MSWCCLRDNWSTCPVAGGHRGCHADRRRTIHWKCGRSPSIMLHLDSILMSPETLNISSVHRLRSYGSWQILRDLFFNDFGLNILHLHYYPLGLVSILCGSRGGIHLVDLSLSGDGLGCRNILHFTVRNGAIEVV